MTTEFRNDDDGYLNWLSKHPDGVVLNCRAKRIDKKYLVLHRASCRTVHNYAGMEWAPGGFTSRDFIKIVAENESDLSRWAQARASATFSKRCAICKV